jgi:hypothetical protein
MNRKKYLDAHKPRVTLSEDGNCEVLLPNPEFEVIHWGVQKVGYNVDEFATSVLSTSS